MKRLAAILLLVMPLSLQADDLLKSATDALKGSGSSTRESVPAGLDFSGGLSSAVSQGLGVTSKQADGGLGSLFSLAQSTLGDEQFGSLAGAVPGIGDLLKAAPALGSGSMAGMAGGLGGYAEAATGASAVYSQFQSLGLSATAIPQYIGIVSSYLQSTGGQQTVDLFMKGVASLL
jgi:hypothetical protein